MSNSSPSRDDRRNTAKHTPGPWEVKPIGSGYSVRGDGNGHCVVFTNTASCSKAALQRNVTKDEEEQANASLCAAAPELLEVLERIVLNPESTIGGHVRAEAVAAIKKARGE